MQATIRLFGATSHKEITKEFPSVQHARGATKKALRKIHSPLARATIFIDGLKIEISKGKGQWIVKESKI